MIPGQVTPQGTDSLLVKQSANNGSIAQAALGNIYNDFGPDSIPLPADPISSRKLRDAELLYETPEKYSDALNILKQYGLVILGGAPAIGKHTAAVRLLWEHARHLDEHPFDPYELLLRQVRKDWDKPTTKRLPIKPRHGYLLDFGNEITPLNSDFAKGLLSYRERLTDVQSCMVITGTNRVLKDCMEVLHDLVITLDVPEAFAIATLRLRADFCKPERIPWLSTAEVSNRLPPGTKPTDAVRMATAISHAPPDETEGIQQAVAEFLGWQEELLDWFRQHEDAFKRAALITAALLEPAPSKKDISLRALDLLTKVDGKKPLELNPLRAPDLSSRLDGIELKQTGSGVSLTQTKSGFDEAVLDHVWKERPELHEHFLAWVLDIAASERRESATVTRIARALTGMSIRAESVVFLDYVNRWVAQSPKNAQLAQAMLDDTVVHPVVGPQVRKRLLAWATGVNLQLAVVTANVCGGELGTQMPDVAMTRLRHILRHKDEESRKAAAEALVKLARQDSIRISLLWVILGWLEKDEHSQAGAVAFLAIVADEALSSTLLHDAIDDMTIRGILAESWRQLARHGLDQFEIVDAMASWILVGERNEIQPHDSLNVLDTALQESVTHTLAREVYLNVHKRIEPESNLPRVLIDQISKYYHQPKRPSPEQDPRGA